MSEPLIVWPALAAEIGLNEAIVLRELARRAHGVGYTDVTLAELEQRMPFFSRSTLKRTIAALRDGGWVTVEQPGGLDRRNQYWITSRAVARLTEAKS